MDWPIIEEPVSCLTEYGQVPIAFRVEQVLEVTPIDGGIGRRTFAERAVDLPFIKDYDAINDNSPACWTDRFDMTHWGVLSVVVEGCRVGGAVLAFDSKGLDLLEGRKDLAVLWDLRVHPERRKHGVGRSLFRAAEARARARACRQIKAETQNINVAACRFYARQGCDLGAINRRAYCDFPDEVQLLWYRDL